MELLEFKAASGVPYSKMYAALFSAITDALRLMEKGNSAEAVALLKRAQQSTEDQYIDSGE